MCGIFGVSYGPDGPGAEDWTPSELMQIMFPAIVHRGPHAYGWMWYDGDNVWYQKYEGRSDTPEALDTMFIENEDKVKWMVCHVRYYTHGSPSNMINNHPIQHGSIMGVHNGIIRNYSEILKETGRDDPACEVDSEAIFAAIDTWGHRAGLRKVQGDMVAVYANLNKPATLHLARTVGRPLELCRSDAGSTLFASVGSVIDATGINHTPFSSLSMHRLIRLREGKVTERITLRQVDPVVNNLKPQPLYNKNMEPSDIKWFHEQQRRRAHKRGQMMFQKNTNPAVIQADLAARQEQRAEARREAAERLRAVAMEPEVQRLRDHDCYKGFYMLGGVLMTEDAYLDSIVNSIVDEETVPVPNDEGA